MSEVELTLEQKRERALAALEAIIKTFQADQKQALKKLDNGGTTAEALRDHYQRKQKTTGIIGSLIQVGLKIFVSSDMPVSLPEKGGSESAVQQTIERYRRTTNEGYEDMYALLNKMKQKVEWWDRTAENCYARLKAAADDQQNIVLTITDICNDMKLSISLKNNEFLDSLRKDPADMSKLQAVVRGAIYK